MPPNAEDLFSGSGTAKGSSAGVPNSPSVGGGSGGDERALVWREDGGVSLKVPKFYLPSKRRQDAVAARFGAEAAEQLTMGEVAKHNKRDDLWIIVDGHAYDVTPFVEKHPGGWLPMVNMGGKDCTDVFANYHPARVYKTMLPAYYLGRVTDYHESKFVQGHRALRQQLLERGLFETRPGFYAWTYAWLASLFGGALWLTLGCQSVAAHLLGAAILALFWQQMAFVGHDTGHNAVTHSNATDSLAGLVVGNLTTGIGMAWWKRSHNVHHVCCNSIEHDPDIQHMPIFAVTDAIFKRFWSTYHEKWVELDGAAKALVSMQHWLFYPVMSLARFNLYVQSILLLAAPKEKIPHRTLEVVGLLGFWAWFVSLVHCMPANHGLAERLAFVLVSHMLAGVLHVQICLSHFGRDTYQGFAYNGEADEWFRMQVATTLNISCPEWLDWFHGGLQFQVEHHLWPRLPRHNLREAAKLVRKYCHEQGVTYHTLPWIQAQVQLVGVLKRTAMAVREAEKGGNQGATLKEVQATTIFECLDVASKG